MELKINERTGLKEGTYPRLRVPLVHQRSINTLRFNGQKTAVHTVPLQNGLTLDFYANLGASDELVVTFHGAMPRTLKDYPWFTRIRSVSEKTKAMISFADPTLQLDQERKMLVSWYFGTPGWDPITDILQVIRRAVGKTGSKHVAFIGGSGGAIPALRAAALLPGSLAFIQDPRISFDASNRHLATYFDVAWPGWDMKSVLKGFPLSFEVTDYYRLVQPKNVVYCVQNTRDETYYGDQFLPFAKSLGVKDGNGVSRNGLYHFESYDGTHEGHGKITSAEFDSFYAKAFDNWRKLR
ncbi:hypothetical protein [Glutamicibacter sp. HZAU]|uniref:hypothetical protein n=1 Tax=Glutamicibacter sp. HZAU TaxID=2049891 RepID=UPI000FFB1079|nr:hypothetical protein [Glutamicibacter sp. HZAU]RWZ83808.1 hypothetical protein EKH49_08405 [Glutamicibacter sp. HZAU]